MSASSHRSFKPSTVSLRSKDDYRLLRRAGRPGPVAVLRSFDAELRHLVLHDPWVGAQTTGSEGLEEDLLGRLALRLVKILREKPG